MKEKRALINAFALVTHSGCYVLMVLKHNGTTGNILAIAKRVCVFAYCMCFCVCVSVAPGFIYCDLLIVRMPYWGGQLFLCP